MHGTHCTALAERDGIWSTYRTHLSGHSAAGWVDGWMDECCCRDSISGRAIGPGEWVSHKLLAAGRAGCLDVCIRSDEASRSPHIIYKLFVFVRDCCACGAVIRLIVRNSNCFCLLFAVRLCPSVHCEAASLVGSRYLSANASTRPTH